MKVFYVEPKAKPKEDRKKSKEEDLFNKCKYLNPRQAKTFEWCPQLFNKGNNINDKKSQLISKLSSQ